MLGTATSVSEEFESTPNDFPHNGAGEALEEEYSISAYWTIDFTLNPTQLKCCVDQQNGGDVLRVLYISNFIIP